MSSLASLAQVKAFNPKRRGVRCEGCGNACLLSVVEFGDGRRFISGNRCERAYEVMFGEHRAFRSKAPNVVALEQGLIARLGDVRAEGPRGAVSIGLMNVMHLYENMPFWHALLEGLGFSVLVPDDDAAACHADEAAGTIPSESVCHPAKLAHLRYAYLANAGAAAVFMPRFERSARCPVSSLYADALRDNVGDRLLVTPLLQSIGPRGIAKRQQDQAILFEALSALAPAGVPIERREFDQALQKAFEAQRAFDAALESATAKAVDWVAADESRRGAVLVGRPYHMDPALLHRIDQELNRLGFAVVPAIGLNGLLAGKHRDLPSSGPFDSIAARKTGASGLSRSEWLTPFFRVGVGSNDMQRGKSRYLPMWKPAKHLVGAVEAAASLPRFDVVALRSFGCLYDAVAFDEARDLANQLHRPFTELKIDDVADTAHIRIRLRTLADTTSLGAAGSAAPPANTTPFGAACVSAAPPACDDASRIRSRGMSGCAPSEGIGRGASVTPDMCSTAKALVNRVLAAVEGSEPPYTVEIPFVCHDCLVDALPFELQHVTGYAPTIEVALSSASRQHPTQAAPSPQATRPLIGLVGNPFLVFDPAMNEGVVQLLDYLGCDVAMPEAGLLEVEDVRYLQQLDAFHQAGVDHVIYLQSFGCLKGHVQSRGALHQLARRYPDMPITVIDYDPESSALNRENRIRLAVEAAKANYTVASNTRTRPHRRA